MADIQTSINIDIQQAKRALSELLQDGTKWSAAMSQKLTANVDLVFPEMSQVVRQFDKYQKAVRSAVKKIGGDAWDFQFYTKGGKEQKEFNFNEVFDRLRSSKLDQASALNYLKQLEELKKRLQAGTAISYGNFGIAETTQLDKLIEKLQKATGAYNELQRTKSKNDTISTTNAARREAAEIKAAYREQQRQEREQMLFNKAVFDAAVKRRREQKKLSDAELRIEQQIAKERSRNVRGGGNSAASILRQIELYHKLEVAAKKAGNAQQIAYSRNQIVALNKQFNALGGLTSAYRQQGDIFRGLTGLAARYFSIYTIANFARKVAETTGYFQQQQVALEGILGSATQAQEILSNIKDFALKSPFQTKELFQFTKLLSAFGIKGEDLFPTVTKLADISAGLGVDMSRIILAYGQVRSAAVLRGQELRQFTEAGIPLVEKLAEKFTALNGQLVTTADVFKLISERKVSFEMVADVLSDMTNEGGRFYKMQESLVDTIYGQIQKLRDMWTLAMDDIGKSMSPVLTGIIQMMQQSIKHGAELAAALSAAFAANRLAKFITHFKGLIRMLRIAAATGGVLTGMFTAVAGVAAFAFTRVINEAGKLQKKFDEIEVSFGKENKKMLDGLDSLTNKLQKSVYGTKEYSDAIGTLAQNYGSFIGSDIISALQNQDSAARMTANAFHEIAEQTKEAIKQYNEYKKLEQKKSAAKEVTEDYASSAGSILNAWLKNNDIDDIKALYTDYSNRYGREASAKDVRSKIVELFKSSIGDFVQGEVFTKEEFGKIYSEYIRNQFPSLTDEELDKIVETGVSAAFNKNVGTLNVWRGIQGLQDTQKDLEATEYNRLRMHFNAVKPEDVIEGSDRFDYINNLAANYIDALNKTLRDKFGNNVPKELSDAIETAFKVVDIDGQMKIVTDNFDSSTIAKINDLFNKFRETFTDNPQMMKWLSELRDEFNRNVTTTTGRTAITLDRMAGLAEYRYSNDEAVRSIWTRYGVGLSDGNYEQRREGLVKEYGELTKELKSYVNKGEEKDRDKIQSLQRQIEAITKLASSEYFNVDLNKNTGSGRNRYERVRMNEFITNLLKLITDADEQVKKIVKVEGYTSGLKEFVDTLDDKNILKKFFEEGAKPFEDIFNDLAKYGLDEKLMPNFNAELLKTIMRDAGWEEGKPLSIPDFERMYQSVLDNISSSVLPEIKRRRESLQKGTSEYNSLEGIETRLEKQLITWRTEKIRIFGGEEIDRKLEDMLRSLTKIELNTEYESELRNSYDRTKGLVGFREAYGAMFDKNYEVYNPVFDKQGTLREILEQKAYAGVMQTKVGDVLDSVSKSANLNIHNLYQILDAIRTLKTNALRQEVLNNDKSLDAGQFERINQQLIKALSETAKAIEENTKAIHASMTPSEQKGMEVDNKREQYLKDLDAIISEEERGAIDSEKATSRSIEAFKKYMDEIAKTLGVQGNLPAVREGTWMSTDMQNFLGGMSGQSSFADQFGRKISEAVANNQMSGKDASAMMSNMNATIAAIDLIIKAIYNAINSFIKIGRSMIRLIKSNNPVTGQRYDEYGNVTYEKAFDETSIEKAEKSFDLIQEWNQHEMDGWEKFKSGDILGSITEFITKFFDLISSINDIVDLDTKRAIEELTRSNKNLQKTIDEMNWQLNYLVGSDKMNATGNIIGVLLKQYDNFQEMIDKELHSKTPDLEAVDEWEENAKNVRRTAIDMVQNIRTEIAGTADELAETLTDAFVSAFKNGENAARSWRDAVNNYVGDVLKKILLTEVLGPQVQEVIDRWMGGTSEQIKNKVGEDGKIHIGDKTYTIYEYYRSRFTDEKNGKLAQGELNALGTAMNDFFASLPEWTRNMIAWNDSASSLSGGIQGITEDTARTLEGLGNSILTQHVLSNKYLETITLLPIANIQTSWFEGMLAAQRQAAQAARNIETSINELRTGSSQPLHVIMS